MKNIQLEIVKTLRQIENKTRIKFPFSIKIKRYLIGHSHFPEFTYVLGHKMYLPKNGPLPCDLIIDGIWEKKETEIIKNEIKEGDVVLDVGANIGYFTLIFAKLVGPQGKVFAFEPEPNDFNLLKKNVEVNGYRNVVIKRKAATEINGKIKLYLSKNNSGQHRIYESKEVSKNFVSVDKIKLDDYFKNLPCFEKISFVKMDIEGSEIGALNGMTSILSKNKNLKILIEYSPIQIRDYGAEPKALLDILKKNDFNFYLIDSKKNRITLVEENALLKMTSLSAVNLLCKRDKRFIQ